MNIRPLPPLLAEKAKLELNEDPSRLQQDLEHLKQWIAKQPHLRARTDDQWLVAFLRSCKYSLEKTKTKFDLYYASRTAAPDLFNIKHNNPLFEAIIRDGVFISLPKTITPDGPRVTLARAQRLNMNKYSFIDVIGTTNTLEKIAYMEDDNLMVAGCILVIDCKGASVSNLTQATPTVLKKLAAIGQESSPLRIKGVHIVNAPTGVETVFNMVKNFIKEKNRHKFYLHSSYEELFKHIPKEIFPSDCGGEGGSTEEIVEYWAKKAKEYSAFFDEEENFGTDEKKRLGQSNVRGSFNKYLAYKKLTKILEKWQFIFQHSLLLVRYT